MSSRSSLFALALTVCAAIGAIDAQTTTATLTITTNGNVSGAVGARASGPGNQSSGSVCNPDPGGNGGGTCHFTFPLGASMRIMANSPNTPGIFNSGAGDAASCATSVCEFTLNGDSAITATFSPGGGPYPSLTIDLLGDGTGNVGTDNNQCQNFELGFSACTTYYGAGSAAMIQGRSMPGNIFAGFSGGTANAAGCSGTANCTFTLSQDSSVEATFAALSSVAIEPGAMTINVGNNGFFSARATFTNGMTRFGFNGNTPWQGHTPMDVERFSLAAAVVGDRLYAIGGVDGFCPGGGPCPFSPLGTVEAFNPLVTAFAEFEQAWTPRAAMATPRESLAAAVVGGRIFAVGGHSIGGNAVESMEAYDPATNTWSARAPMSEPRARMAAAVINDTIYVAGGNGPAPGGGEVPLKTLEAYDALNDAWAPKANMLTARSAPAAATVNGILYVIGGDNTGSVEAYDPVAEAWTMKAPLPNGGGSHRAVALDGLIYAVGGSPVTVKVYNPALDSWATLTSSMPIPVSGEFALAAFDGRLFAAGGNDTNNVAVSTLSANRPPEATWWSNNSSVGRINSFNSGSVNGVATGQATISARLVGIDSGAQSALLTVTTGGGGGGSTIFLGIPSSRSTTVGQADWGCGTFGQNADGPWEVKINYGEGGGNEVTPYSLPPAPCGGGPGTKGWFFFNHAYSMPGTFTVTVTVRNTATNASTTQSFPVEVQAGGGGGGDCAPVIINIAKIGSVPLETVHGALFDRPTDELLGEGEFPFGLFDEFALPEGQFRLELSVPAGYTVTPSSFNLDTVCGQTLNINATVQPTPPTISVALSPNELWPPNNKMRNIAATITASPGATVTLVSITSNEPGGAADIAGASVGTDDRSFQLRAKRLGGGNGRTYTVTYQATSASGTTTVTATVVVPHDQGQ